MVQFCAYEGFAAMTDRTLTPDQTEKVRAYHKARASLRGEEFADPGDAFLSIMVGTYNLIQLEGGGDPTKAAEKLI